MLSAFIFVAITTRFGKKHRDISDKQSYLVRFTVRIVEFTFEIGCSIIGTLVGLAVSAYMLHFLGAITVSQHSILFAFAVVVFAILYAFMLLTISMFEHANCYQFVLNIASIIYIAFVLSLFFYFELYLAIAYFGSAMTLFLIVRQVRKCISYTQQ
ncbi:hypothetical protein A9264_04745 [Vibrio sp. UCD-FRSSP16_10]|nr:hypothetical protein A9260_06985 [Vibrio sp. UCD-FRSSP16_30]OBT18075.1 hypothetical protein A9264_04745 [Vibrio sp. UCD-FRSSP16_10]